MKRLIILCCILCVSTSVFSQNYARKKKKKKTSFSERMWIGGNLNNLRFGSNVFSIGLTPMAGVMMTENLSIGLFVKVDYYYENITLTPPKIKFETVDVGPGIFARLGFLRTMFGQVEYESAFLQRPVFDIGGFPVIEGNQVVKETIRQNYVYLGLGYESGEQVKFVVSIHYNVLDDIESIRFPWDYRFGVRYNLGPPPESERKR